MQRILQERVVSSREAEFNRLKQERRERISQIIQSRKQEREARRKMLFFLRTEEERQKRLQEEEEARKREEAERRKKEEAERQAKLDEIAEKQRLRLIELEEKVRREKEEGLRKPAVLPMPAEPPALGRPTELGGAAPVPAAAAATPAAGKYVPRHLRGNVDAAGQAPPPETDRWGGTGSKPDDRPSWRDERKPTSFGSSGSRTSWSSSRR
uniref:Putative ovule protein n=1 Tax=Solanum chacoense TaxID=4108 RepID=A0A0V0I2K2_SOLCH